MYGELDYFLGHKMPVTSYENILEQESCSSEYITTYEEALKYDGREVSYKNLGGTFCKGVLESSNSNSVFITTDGKRWCCFHRGFNNYQSSYTNIKLLKEPTGNVMYKEALEAHGSYVNFSYIGRPSEIGRLSIEGETVYICHDSLSGDGANETFEFKKSWGVTCAKNFEATFKNVSFAEAPGEPKVSVKRDTTPPSATNLWREATNIWAGATRDESMRYEPPIELKIETRSKPLDIKPLIPYVF